MRLFIALAALGGILVTTRAEGPTRAIPGTAAQRQGTDFQWRGRLDAGKTIEIRGVNGDVRIERASGGDVEVRATKRARRSDPDEVEITVVPHQDGVTICALYPSWRGRENECRPGGGGRNSTHDNDTQVEFAVRVPAGVRVEGHTVNGDVVALDLASDVYASTVNGGVDVSTSEMAEAETVNGSVHASMGKADWTGTMRFKTVNGSVTVAIPSDFSADIDAGTVNGQIETDFPITVTGRFSNRRMHGTIGNGGRRIEMETVNGSIRLQRSR